MGRQSEYGIVCVPIHDVLTRALFAYKKHDEAVLKTYLFSLFSYTAIEFNNVKAWKMT